MLLYVGGGWEKRFCFGLIYSSILILMANNLLYYYSSQSYKRKCLGFHMFCVIKELYYNQKWTIFLVKINLKPFFSTVFGVHRSKPCYKETLLQRNYRPMTILWSFSYTFFVNFQGKKLGATIGHAAL